MRQVVQRFQQIAPWFGRQYAMRTGHQRYEKVGCLSRGQWRASADAHRTQSQHRGNHGVRANLRWTRTGSLHGGLFLFGVDRETSLAGNEQRTVDESRLPSSSFNEFHSQFI